MTGSARQTLEVLLCVVEKGEGVRGRVGQISHRTGGWRMTGSAQTRSGAVRLIMLLGEKKKERVWERKGLGLRPDRRLADDGKR